MSKLSKRQFMKAAATLPLATVPAQAADPTIYDRVIEQALEAKRLSEAGDFLNLRRPAHLMEAYAFMGGSQARQHLRKWERDPVVNALASHIEACADLMERLRFHDKADINAELEALKLSLSHMSKPQKPDLS